MSKNRTCRRIGWLRRRLLTHRSIWGAWFERGQLIRW